MKLSKTIAQKIVLEMMNVIPYNINVMDENGVIIGSGDINRIGNIHEGAKNAINNKHINQVYAEDEKMKPGVNEPIIFNEEVIGVIGITGHPDEVRRFSKLVRVTAVLLIEQAKIDEEVQNERLNMQKFYHELAHRKTIYDDKFHERAKSYGLDLTKKCQVILVEGNINAHKFKTLCQKYSHYNEINNRMAFFTTSNHIYKSLLEDLKGNNEVNKISIGGMEDIAAISLENAELAMEFGAKIKPASLFYNYEELKFIIHLAHANKMELVSLMSNLDKAGNKLELIQTIEAYIEENGDISSVANKLNIHRNTLNYRLERINNLTGKNPKNLLELFELLCGLIWR
ncbi:MULTISPECIES: CdaR family transcriptional regulator [Clostridium]|uniref:CdaR family transcriptional regulator n=1 Tax=Clostridium TaxID=1485 RepID=UPI000983F8E3|nr:MULTISPECIES: sugar diacid recognition domain-containing protein [Clostridium]AQR93584.1 carbohydrate diacid regulator [Clostridium saccharoperbutylacetonicum]NSB29283.1 carbohydrate diacid regulator [Clostridium saccharoperbutylacetonicum]